MRRIRQICKALFVSLAVVMIALAPMGCGKKDAQPSSDQAPPEHPVDGDHPAGEHPE